MGVRRKLFSFIRFKDGKTDYRLNKANLDEDFLTYPSLAGES
jgi:hypothetical protein